MTILNNNHGETTTATTTPTRSHPTTSNKDEVNLLLKDKIVGSILGIFIGDALGVGVHWQYNLTKLEQDRGGYVSGYLDPLPGTYHSGTNNSPAGPNNSGRLHAGDLDLLGTIDKLLLQSLVSNDGKYNSSDFYLRIDQDIFQGDPTFDGTRHGGKYGWTDKSICDLYSCHVTENKPWDQCSVPRSDTPDIIIQSSILGALYYQTPYRMAVTVRRHAKSWTLDSSVQSHSVAFASMVAAIIQGVPLNAELSNFLYQQSGRSLPYSSLIANVDYDPIYGTYSEPDSLLWYGSIANGVAEFHSNIEPAHRGVLLYGQFCAYFATVPSAYYCTSRYPKNFTAAVLCSVNGGGQTTLRTSLVGALVGANVGISNIPQHFLTGLKDYDEIVLLAQRIADLAVDNKWNDADDVWYWPPPSIVPSNVDDNAASAAATAAGVLLAADVSGGSGWEKLATSAVSLVPTFSLFAAALILILAATWRWQGTTRKKYGQYEPI